MDYGDFGEGADKHPRRVGGALTAPSPHLRHYPPSWFPERFQERICSGYIKSKSNMPSSN